MIEANANYFKAASLCVSKEETRYYLNGVFIEPCAKGGATLTATDGHRLISIHDKDAVCDGPAIVSLPKGALTKKCPDGKIVVSDDGIFRHGNFISTSSVIIDGVFPDWRHLIRGKAWTSKSMPAINAVYLGDFGKISEAVFCGVKAIRLMTGSDEGQPVLVVFPSIPNAFGVVMPIRADKSPKEFMWAVTPKSVTPKKKPEAQEKAAA